MLVKEQTGRVAVVGHGKKDYNRNYRFREKLGVTYNYNNRDNNYTVQQILDDWMLWIS